jgi:sucrose synthase
MLESLKSYLESEKQSLYLLFRQYQGLNRSILLHTDLWDEFEKFCQQHEEGEALLNSGFAKVVKHMQEAVIGDPWIYFTIRNRIGRWQIVRIHVEMMEHEEVSVEEFLHFKERVVKGVDEDKMILEIDLRPFNREFPRMQESRSIGRGVEFLNRRLSSQLFKTVGQGAQRLLDFLRVHQVEGLQLMLNQLITTVEELQQALRQVEEFLAQQDPDADWDALGHTLQSYGFEPGWGKNAARMRETMLLLSDILEAPEPATVETFLGRIPMIFKIAVISPHGFFGQDKVLGLPDTGGQVVYILDQVRALEKEMRARVAEQGLEITPQIYVLTRLIPEARNTTCDQRLEHIIGTENAYILRVPFRNENGEVVPQWITRFEIWPYLERFAIDASRELIAEMGGRPDLIIGNYSDGNLVASMLSRSLGVTQCNIAHALEKAKYLFSDLYWKENEEHYHFSVQFTADLIAMNSADFIVTSTYQEIAGTQNSVGQYESYNFFTMPDLYRVVDGIDIFDPKFNIVSPGADSAVYFPYTESERRVSGLQPELERMVFDDNMEDCRGHFQAKDKPVIFTMARLDYIKNITGLVQWYAENEELRKTANLLVIAGYTDVNKSSDREEQEQIKRMHTLFDQYQLDGSVRWVGRQLNKRMAGELYRYVADLRGVFVQPALFEAFGLTVIEAMTSGLPTFATMYGGPLEIIEDGISGFHIDPNHGEQVSEKVLAFLKRAHDDPGYWELLSEGAIARVKARYTWELYAERIMTLSRIYGFWKYVTNLERDETRRYLEMFYALQYRPAAEGIKH